MGEERRRRICCARLVVYPHFGATGGLVSIVNIDDEEMSTSSQGLPIDFKDSSC
jgi:hypothetical protein